MKRGKPVKLSLLEAVWRYLPVGDSYEETSREMIRRRQAGFVGEQRGDAEWKLLDSLEPFDLLHDLHLPIEEVTYQLDTIFISRKFILIVEMKNIAGEVNFDEEKHQFTRRKEDEPTIGLSNPADQVERHRRKLSAVLLHGLGIQLPIIGAVVFANSSTIIGKTVPGIITIHLSGLQRLLDNLYEYYTQDVLSPGQARQLADYLQTIHSPKMVYPTSLIPEAVFKRLRNGVMCTRCDRVQMHYEWKTWTCPRCGLRDKNGHIRALQDYRLLYGETITNKQFREFCRIESISASSRLLRELNLPFTGSYRNRTYRLK
ncbi:nuclease-related domain-containing protein [Chungangia koreensis]|uniref:Nuclease-related domain-containing protein n=1 Tax=Chungangia koreensis TaxID=752657 RepID=A0ABV8X7F0_9LACT